MRDLERFGTLDRRQGVAIAAEVLVDVSQVQVEKLARLAEQAVVDDVRAPALGRRRGLME
jgi:hypothetical protein